MTVDMTGLDKTQLLFWLSGVYTSDWSAAKEHLNESAIKNIQRFVYTGTLGLEIQRLQKSINKI